jgi:hypothetical protein
MPSSGFAHESICGSAHFIGALMARLETRIERLEAALRQRRRPVISGERRKALTDRAVLHGDLDALHQLSLHRPDEITASQQQRAAALAAGLRADM